MNLELGQTERALSADLRRRRGDGIRKLKEVPMSIKFQDETRSAVWPAIATSVVFLMIAVGTFWLLIQR